MTTTNLSASEKSLKEAGFNLDELQTKKTLEALRKKSVPEILEKKGARAGLAKVLPVSDETKQFWKDIKKNPDKIK